MITLTIFTGSGYNYFVRVYAYIIGIVQITGDGITRRERAVRSFAVVNGHTIAKFFYDTQAPATGDPLKRPGFCEMVESARINNIKSVLVESFNDLISGDFVAQELIRFRLAKQSISFVSAIEDPRQRERELLQEFGRALAAAATADLVERLSLGRSRKKIQGEMRVGRKSYGHNPGEAVILDRFRKLREHGLTWSAIAEDARASALQTRTGLSWWPAQIRRVVTGKR